MTNFRAVNILLLDDLFEMGGDHVLNFPDPTFAHAQNVGGG